MASPQFTDYYSLLEISVESDAKTINKAYRKKALQYHPDKNKGNANATDMFKLVKEAKEILLDEERRAAYDKKHRAMLMRKAGREKMDKRQRELREALNAKEDEAKRRRQGELSEKERLLLRLSQIRKENEKTIEVMLHDKDIAYDLQSKSNVDINSNLKRSSDYGKKTLERLKRAAQDQIKARA